LPEVRGPEHRLRTGITDSPERQGRGRPVMRFLVNHNRSPPLVFSKVLILKGL
jgi:hypothetical protein